MEQDSGVKPTSERHVPVLLERCIALLEPGILAARAAGRTPVVVDSTLGMGGHSEALLSRYEDLHLVGIDRDTQALALAGERLAPFDGRTDLVHAVYDEIEDVLDDLGIESADGVLMDLGVSSLQLDERERGFAYSFDAPLDMRMNGEDAVSARDVVETYSFEDLARIIRRYGEERFAARIARAIVARRETGPISRTGELVEVIRDAVPAAYGKTGGHPAKRTFQALRIEVNEELTVLERAVPASLGALSLGGRFVAMSYHSLEDAIVKREIVRLSVSTAPKGMPVELEEHKPELARVTRGTEKPTEDEIAENSRAASARLRAAERIRARR
ncbi:16S rRNA (cytosine(1402)-N(4))-methyltransferase RsmH [Falsarthrobacter nasiphocae]|uniref:Ribosomal RNA small subunit methyltransferase H n=1 Tax=Falsarthrobacter nasiphocae TaxID=189863 RepID=A0AAE3YG02_9MICC|nr:16S rRNA (cytosine(1402)-N(4))-methyltransferase RsmH [Falsarthrobacter nasiphocae]MDR6891326.1 16S rRNA (cytosine1402-N4)-methyltransferase [Falsarthrobacter nasiphocae]